MDKPKKAKLPIKKIIGICLIITLLSGVGVFASNVKINNVRIILSSGYEMNVVTSKTKVSDILQENHIVHNQYLWVKSPESHQCFCKNFYYYPQLQILLPNYNFVMKQKHYILCPRPTKLMCT